MRNIGKYIYLILFLTTGMVTTSWGQTITGNVYGGGEMAKVNGNTHVIINNGNLGADIFGGGEGTLYTVAGGGHAIGDVSMSADVSGETHVTINGGEFAVAYDDTKPQPYPFMQHYNIYGGGNVACEVGESHVYVTKGMVSNASDGSDSFLDNDRFERGEAGMAQAYYHEGQMYFCIFGGGYGKNTSVTGDTWVDFNISGMTDINSTAIEDDLLEYQSYLDIVGGGFNGTVGGNTNVHMGGNAMCRNVYGGGLYATIGNKGRGDTGETHVHITGGNIDNVYGGGVMGDIMTSTNVNIGLKAASLSFDGHSHDKDNDKITILMSVYGGNDVSGHVPTANITHNGGKVEQNIYGAGNGNYRGYYTPNVCDYAEGENDNYYNVTHEGDDANSGPTYKGRPQTDNVNITLGGNNNSDKAVVLGQVFGGGNSCTVGHWKTDLSSKYGGDPHKWRDDPEFFEGGGQLNITLNSHVTIGQPNSSVSTDYQNEDGENVSGLFMGCSGHDLATQTTNPEDYTYHHYYDTNTKKYWQGFAVYQEGSSTPMTRAEGQKSFNAYLNNILIWSDDVQLNIANDAEDIWLANFVGGGFRGSMKRKTKTSFEWTLPAGVTVGNCVVGGAYNTDVVYRIYQTSDGHTYTTTDGHYNYLTNAEGLSQGTDYDHIIYGATENIKGIARFMYAGGLLCNDGTTFADAVLTLNNNMVGGEAAGVFGGCYASGTVKNTQIDYRATGAHSVYGGGALANLSGNSVVNLLGGNLTDAYGGGLGRLADTVKDYAPVSALVNGNATTTLNGSVVNGSIYGANNVNGTPLGHVKVHVLATADRGQANRNKTGNENNFDVKAVYGGGNLSAYEPTNDNDFAEVLIENCDNSIAYVYGGGNAAPVPATDVTIYGANAIDHAFAGGNGAGLGNLGADVGYKEYMRDEEHQYGTGKAAITVYGGTVNNVYGGSNTLGYIRGGTAVTVTDAPDSYEGAKCNLAVGKVYGGGNEADIDCDITMNLDCAEGGAILYAGANNANVKGNVTLNIYSGTYGQVFCGNNQGGNIYGNLKVNVDETGCWPVMIGELYACGYGAPYSVYGYDDEGNIRTEGERQYADPEVNLISFTRIGKVFGGGYGETAVLYGNTHVNVEPIPGKFAGKTVSPAFVLNDNDERVQLANETTMPHGVTNNGDGSISIAADAGSIGTIYGGGNAGAVHGDTEVKIGTKTKNKHISGDDKTTEYDVAVTITGNVFGGGNEAIVSGDTKVTIGANN